MTEIIKATSHAKRWPGIQGSSLAASILSHGKALQLLKLKHEDLPALQLLKLKHEDLPATRAPPELAAEDIFKVLTPLSCVTDSDAGAPSDEFFPFSTQFIQLGVPSWHSG